LANAESETEKGCGGDGRELGGDGKSEMNAMNVISAMTRKEHGCWIPDTGTWMLDGEGMFRAHG
jgi:hypothetical protein